MGRGAGEGEGREGRVSIKSGLGHSRGGTKQEGVIQGGKKVEGTKWGKTSRRGLGMEPGVRKSGGVPELVTKGTRRIGDWSIYPGG
jgi:hypothetical protein